MPSAWGDRKVPPTMGARVFLPAPPGPAVPGHRSRLTRKRAIGNRPSQFLRRKSSHERTQTRRQDRLSDLHRVAVEAPRVHPGRGPQPVRHQPQPLSPSQERLRGSRHRRGSERHRQVVHPGLAGRGAEPRRHVGPQGRQQLQAHLHQRPRHPGLQPPAPNGQAHGQGLHHPVHAHRGEQPRPGDLLRPHRTPADGRHAVPLLRHHRHPGKGPQKPRAGSCGGPRLQGRSQGKLHEGGVSGRQVRSHGGGHRSQQRGLPGAGPEPAQGHFAEAAGGPPLAPGPDGRDLPPKDGDDRSVQDGQLHRAGREHGPLPRGPGGVRPLQGIREDPRRLRAHRLRTEPVAFTPAGGGGKPLRHRGRPRSQRLGHARRQ